MRWWSAEAGGCDGRELFSLLGRRGKAGEDLLVTVREAE